MHDLIRPVVVAPMAGGPSTPALVIAAAQAGAVGFLAAGYKTPDLVEAELRAVRGASVGYGLNLFVPAKPPQDVAAVDRYRRLLQVEADRYGVDLPPVRLRDDDHFDAKVDLAVTYAPPLVSFTFGVPEKGVVVALQAAGVAVAITVTSAAEAEQALTVGPEVLIAQGGTAGGHSSTMSPAGYRGNTTAVQVLAAVRAVTDLPVIAAGGTGTAADVRELVTAGAVGVQAGTVFLLADEAGTRPAQRAVMQSQLPHETVVTRAFTGQPARALRNRFTDEYSEAAPVGYPAVHHLTAPIRAAAAERGDAGALNLWAGIAHTKARQASAAEIVASLIG
ncbi:nitronate monooxygenase [Actinoplanes derwentensis]|uniref:Propionate 3-nitronate monooxygenase n=1 Tax=Actinoplanes derwentensis TaxID=113562 RepID=A0A1H1U3Q2_9ACTN|nr:nitronate monooxygenase [Actinoplanes derwentensis]GID85185.1 oxidoreductase [Actinoplanes derwentensis]SDS67047.1 nitroalkane oxidase [Actinoplanes derwentensis]